MSSNLGKWMHRYADAKEAAPYGDTQTYQLGIDFLSDCEYIEDWGCGLGWFRHLAKDRGLNITNIDGTASPFCDYVRDLVHYRPVGVDGIFLRHVLEHNPDWEKVLLNALDCARKKVAIVLFTPCSGTDKTEQISWVSGYEVPDLSLPLDHIWALFHRRGYRVDIERLTTATYYGQETTIFGTRIDPRPTA